VQRGQVPAALRCSLIGREVVAGALKHPVLAALERGDCRQAALRLEQGDLKPSQLAMWLTHVEAYMAAASDSAAASDASTLPSLSPLEVLVAFLLSSHLFWPSPNLVMTTLSRGVERVHAVVPRHI